MSPSLSLLSLSVGLAAIAMAAPAVRATRRTLGAPRKFAHLLVSSTKIFYTTPCEQVVALTGLHPVLPGHILIVPTRPATHLHELTVSEMSALFGAVTTVQHLIGTHVGATAFNIAIKDGAAAGQPVPQVHVHVVPRKPGQLERGDEVYELIDRWSPRGKENLVPPLAIPADEDRSARSEEDMAAEARSYRVAAGAASGPLPPDAESVLFGRFRILPSQVFYASSSGLSLALVNLKPLCRGHVLVIPRRVVASLAELTAAELDDLWLSTREVEGIVGGVHGATAYNVGVQDGKDAGQTVPHVHVHVLPR